MSTTSAPPDIPPIPAGPEPDWLTVLYPKPGQIVSLTEYDSATRPTTSGSLPAPEVSASICMQVWASALFDVGDFWESEDIVSRTMVLVNNIEQEIAPGLYDGIVLHTKVDAEGNVVGSVGGPYSFCATAPVTAGVHQVDLSFQKSSGELEHFSWTFAAVEGPVPTPTPLPVPSTVDRQGNLPDYLHVVYPPPGETVPLLVDSNLWLDALSVWPHLETANEDFVCFAMKPAALHTLGALPRNYRDWPNRIFFTLDGQLFEHWLYPSRSFRGINAYCVETDLEVGNHVATLYIDPFDAELVTYSWGFTIGK